MAAAASRPPHSGRYRIPGGCGEESVRRVSARNPPVCPALQPPPCARGTRLPRRRLYLRPSHLAELSQPRSLPANPRQSLPQRALEEHPRETPEWKLGLQEHRQDGERDKSHRDAQGVAQSGALSGEDEKGGDKPEICGRGDWRSPRALVRVLREPGIFASHPLCPLPRPLPTGNDPGRGGETGKSSRAGSRPPPFPTPRPSFLPSPEAKSPALGLLLLRSPRRGGGQQWPALRPDVGGREVHKGFPERASPLASLPPGPIRRAPGWIRQRTRAKGHDRELGRAGGVQEPGEAAVVRAGEPKSVS